MQLLDALVRWQAGQRMHREILGSQQAVHGAEIVSALPRRWIADFGRGFSVKNLRHVVRLARAFLDGDCLHVAETIEPVAPDGAIFLGDRLLLAKAHGATPDADS